MNTSCMKPFNSTIGVGLIALLIGVYLIRRTRQPKLKAGGRIEKLFIYPIKSVPGIEVDHLEMEKTVVKYKNIYDRHWILINDQGGILTLRTEPRLAQIQMSYVDNHLVLKASDMPDLHLHPIEQIAKGHLVYPTTVWGQNIDGLYAGDQESEWFARYLDKKGVKLLQFHPKLRQYRKGDYLENNKTSPSAKNPIRYQDGAACHLVNEASCEDFRCRLQEEETNKDHDRITYRRFRPNVLAVGFEPYAEDRWTLIKMGNCMFDARVPCGRCRLTTLDLNTLNFEEEPLHTLRKYRMPPAGICAPNAPMMGVYLQNTNCGSMKVGDIIYTD